ncbi:hypothetical protein ACFT43_05020 [Streptomyces albidoflavus]
MNTRTLPRPRLDGAGWAHPYALTPFSPILYADGGGTGSGDGGQGGTGTGEQGDPAGEQGGQVPPQQKPATPPQKPTDGDETTLPAWAQKALSDARAEAGKGRVTAKQKAADEARQEIAQQIGKALGLVQDDGPPDPAKLTEQVADLSGQLRAARSELAAYRAAGAEGANAPRLLNSRSFADKLAALDPAAEGFDDQLKKLITDEVATDPDLYRAAPAGPPRGGAEFHGAPAGDRKPATLTDAIAARLGG